MEKAIYYVSVQAGTILQEQGAAAYEFEIEATSKEVEQLQELMDMKEDAEGSTLARGATPYIPYHLDQANDIYDAQLVEVYRAVHRLGTASTRQHIESIGIL
jgi:hypothetical protein